MVDTESLDRCGYYHHCHEEKKRNWGGSKIVIPFFGSETLFCWKK